AATPPPYPTNRRRQEERSMSRSWLKLIGTKEQPCPESYTRSHAASRRPMRCIRPGDLMVLYAVGSRRVFALAEVTSEVYSSGDANWPYRVDIRSSVNLPVASGVPLDEVSTPERNLLLSVRQAAYVELSPQEYERAATRLQEASGSEDKRGRESN